jgi:hypothetical protein
MTIANTFALAWIVSIQSKNERLTIHLMKHHSGHRYVRGPTYCLRPPSTTDRMIQHGYADMPIR